MNHICSCTYFRPAECAHYKRPERECEFLKQRLAGKGETNGDRIRRMIATDIALAEELIKRARTDEGQDMHKLWCDNKGKCLQHPDECREEWLMACVLRWVRAEAKEEKTNGND